MCLLLFFTLLLDHDCDNEMASLKLHDCVKLM